MRGTVKGSDFARQGILGTNMAPRGLVEPHVTPCTPPVSNNAVEFQMLNATPDGRVSRSEAARFLGFKPKTLANWQRLGIGPKSILVGGRRFYHVDELKAYANGEKQVRPEVA